MMIRSILAAATIMAVPCLSGAQQSESPSPAQLAAIAGNLAPSLVKVEVTAQYDMGEAPGADPWAAWRAYWSGQDGGRSGADDAWDELIKQERPGERGGYLVSPTLVFTSDPLLHPRFVKSVRVRWGDQVVDARPAAYWEGQPGMLLELAGPLEGAKPLAFDAKREEPYYAATYERRDGAWTARVAGMRSAVAVTEDGRSVIGGQPLALIVDKGGVPVAMTGGGDLAIDGSWRGSPLKRANVDAAKMETLLTALEQSSSAGLLRVTLNLRSPRSTDQAGMDPYRSFYGMTGQDDSETLTEWHGTGVLMNDRTILVLANLKPKTTARLERIRVYTADGSERAASFTGTLRDWGAMLVTLDAPVEGAVRLSSEPVTAQRDRLLLKAEVRVRGQTRTAHLSHDRVSGFYTAWHGRVFPNASAVRQDETSYYGRGSTAAAALNFLFDLGGALVAAPMERRERVSTQGSSGAWAAQNSTMVPAAVLAEVLAQGMGAFDQENKPLSEDEENRLAWLGVEMQGLNKELARINNVSEHTKDGESGAIVTYVYADSPAAAAGLEVGDIVLRLHVEGEPKPLDVVIEDHGMGGMMDQFWAQLDQVPDEYFEQYFDQMPKPWGSAESALTRALTDVGFGRPFAAEVFRGGQVEMLEFVVTQGPAHFESAPRHKSEDLGLTVRDMTYEVRRYFQMKPEDPGVIISKVELGGKSAVAGLKPLEIIRTINDEPVKSVKDFEEMAAKEGELRMAIKRMTQGRTVKVQAAPQE